jgi:hypothetical protein
LEFGLGFLLSKAFARICAWFFHFGLCFYHRISGALRPLFFSASVLDLEMDSKACQPSHELCVLTLLRLGASAQVDL